jgi:hypothetical protein
LQVLIRPDTISGAKKLKDPFNRLIQGIWAKMNFKEATDTIKELMSSPKCRSVEVINNPARPESNHMEVNCINYK